MIDWSTVDVGDVVEWRNGEKKRIRSFVLDTTKRLSEVSINNLTYRIDGGIKLHGDDGSDIVAIHKNGTVGAMSHEERSRLWDKMEAYSINVLNRFPGCSAYEGKLFGVAADGATPLEAVMKCVAAIEAKENAK